MKRIHYTHRLDGRMWAMLVRESQRNLWRVAPLYDVDDLLQEGLICYHRCRSKYHVPNASHFMTLLRRAFMNRIHRLSKLETRDRQARRGVSLEVAETPGLGIVLASLPGELRALVALLESGEFARQRAAHSSGPRRTTNQTLCSMLGLDPTERDLESEFRTILTER